MSVHLIVGVVAIVMVSISGIASSLIMSGIVEKVNRHLPEASRVSPYGWYATKTLRALREYRRYYPGGNLVRIFWMSAGLALSSMLVCAWALGFFSR